MLFVDFVATRMMSLVSLLITILKYLLFLLFWIRCSLIDTKLHSYAVLLDLRPRCYESLCHNCGTFQYLSNFVILFVKLCNNFLSVTLCNNYLSRLVIIILKFVKHSPFLTLSNKVFQGSKSVGEVFLSHFQTKLVITKYLDST